MAYKNKEKEEQNRKRYYQKNKERILENKRKYYQKNKEKILKKTRLSGKKWYQKNKKKVQFQHKKYYQENKEKSRLYHKKYYQENKTKIALKTKRYYQKNIERMRQRKKEYMHNPRNKEKFLIYKKSWQKHKRKTDHRYRLDENMGTAISISLKGKKAGKKWETLVSYTLEDLIKHLEKQFIDKINWNNYGSYWAVDHIKPKSLFNYNSQKDLEFKKCWSLNNLQPLEKIKNIKKNNYYIG